MNHATNGSIFVGSVYFDRPVRSAHSSQEYEKRVPTASDTVLLQSLMDWMRSGSFCKPGLTIRRLAMELGYPEHQLRRLINSQLGFKNFSAFLNGYRIQEAKNRLSQAEYARTQILIMAMDLGYGSLGPFNRAFKIATGTTPTRFRNQSVFLDIGEI